MIVLKRFNDQANLIHLIIGPETFHQLELVGILSLDLDDILSEIPDAGKRKNILAITRSDCEQDTAMFINEGGMAMLPGLANNAAGGDPLGQGQAAQNVVHTPNNNEKAMPPQEILQRNDPRGTFVAGLKCSKCGEPGSFVKTSEVPKCSTCIKIDVELEKLHNEKPSA